VRPTPGLILACDVPSLERLSLLISQISSVQEISGFKIGAAIALRYGMAAIVKEIRSRCNNSFILYDHQKAGTDIPDTAKALVSTCAEVGINALIVFPQSGPQSLVAYVRAVQEFGLTPIVGGMMTHRDYLKSDGGFIDDSAPLSIYKLAADLGVTEFVVPATRLEKVAEYSKMLDARGVDAGFWSPGIGIQGGSAAQMRTVLSNRRLYPIVGRAIYDAKDPREAASQIAHALLAE
jgi:orotidine-5'-phosphate decarboxylase